MHGLRLNALILQIVGDVIHSGLAKRRTLLAVGILQETVASQASVIEMGRKCFQGSLSLSIPI